MFDAEAGAMFDWRRVCAGAVLTLLALCAAYTVPGCLWPGGGDDPCDLDALACENHADEFALDPSCELVGDLDVVLGQGAGSFEELAEGEAPQVHSGVQGGSHFFGAFRVLNPPPDPYALLRVTFDASSQTSESAEEPVWESFAARTLVLGGQNPLSVGPDGTVEEAGLLIVINGWPTSEMTALDLLVEDPCGRTGNVRHVVPPS